MATLFFDERFANFRGWSEASILVRGLDDAGRYIDAVKAALLEGDLQVALLVWDWRCSEEPDERAALLGSIEFEERSEPTAAETVGLAGAEATWGDVFRELHAILFALVECHSQLPFRLVEHFSANRKGSLPLGMEAACRGRWDELVRDCRSEFEEVQHVD